MKPEFVLEEKAGVNFSSVQTKDPEAGAKARSYEKI